MLKTNNVTLKQEGLVVIPQKVSDKINYLCTKIGHTEWSGVLFYKVMKGDLKKIENLELELTDIYLQDIGSSVSTEFINDVDLLDIYEQYEELEDCRIGSIHSHHSMGAYHSATDISDMEDNCKVYNSYLSIVVNNAGDKVAKIGVPMKKQVSGEVTTTFQIQDEHNKPIYLQNQSSDMKEEAEATLFINMKIEEEIVEVPFDEPFIKRVDEKLKESRKPKTTTYSYPSHHVKGYSSHYTGHNTFTDPMGKAVNDFNDNLHPGHIPIVTKKVISSFLDAYLTASGTQYKMNDRLHFYDILYKIDRDWKNLDEYVGVCDEYLPDLISEFAEQGYSDEEILIGAVKDLSNYVSYQKVVDAFVLSLSEFSKQFIEKTS